MEPYGPELSTGYYQATPSQTLPPKAGAFIYLFIFIIIVFLLFWLSKFVANFGF